MAQLTDFIGTWKAENGPPFSKHTFTWQQLDGHLVGRWQPRHEADIGVRFAGRD